MMIMATASSALAATLAVPALHPLEQSDLIVKTHSGALVVAKKDGSGIDGVKLSQHDREIGSPSMAVAPDGSIHVAFVESHRTTGAHAIYHRASTDGGKTWTEAKNLSEDMPGIDVGRCQVLVDARNRVYVIWRAAINETWTGTISSDPVACRSNLWFRELEGGKWSKAKPVSELCTQQTQQDAARSFFAAVDDAGRAQVIWNVLPDRWHPEVLSRNAHSSDVGNGLVFQSTLDGVTAAKPREVFLPAYVSKDTSVQSQLTHETGCKPGPAAAAFDRDGHLLLVMIQGEYGIVHSTAFGVNLAGGGHATPTLRFLKF